MVTIVPIFSDIHAGSKVAIMPPDGWIDEDGMEYKRNLAQKLAWQQWRKSWEFVKAIAEKHDEYRYIVVANGDMVDGDHHNTHQVYTKSLIAQSNIAETIIRTGLDIIGFDPQRDKGYMTEGTPAHVGMAHEYEDDLAARLDFVPRMKGRWLHGHLKLKVNGVNLDIAHHGGSIGGRAWTRNNGLNSIAQSLYFDALDRGTPIPDWVFRSHLHKFGHGSYYGRRSTVHACVLPAWQFKTHYGNKVAVDSEENIGLLVLEIENGQSTLHTSFIEYESEGWK